MYSRRIHQSTNSHHDLVVVGGGVYGACLTLEAARRGLRPLLLEKNDFGGATSWNSLRIAHGGLRYLQTLDLPRFRRSVAEQAWWLKNFPELVRPLQCLMPLYGVGLRRNSLMRGALLLNDQLARSIRRRIIDPALLPPSRLVSPQVTSDLFPEVDHQGLRGGAVWYDALIHSPQRLMTEVLRWARVCGASTLNYVEACEPIVEGGHVTGVTARCSETQEVVTISTSSIVNCAGPWAQRLAMKFDRGTPEFFAPTLAFNVLLNRHPLAPTALAVTPKVANGHTYFLVPHDNHILAGTTYAPWCGDNPPTPRQEHLEHILRDLNTAVPSFKLTSEDILRVDAGILPARHKGSAKPTNKPTFYDHGRHGGPRGCVSILGVKYTTARAIAEKTLRMLYHGKGQRLPSYQPVARPQSTFQLDRKDFPTLESRNRDGLARRLRELIETESVVHLDDLLLRRTDWCRDPRDFAPLAATVADVLGWSETQRESELRRVEKPSVMQTQLASGVCGE